MKNSRDILKASFSSEKVFGSIRFRLPLKGVFWKKNASFKLVKTNLDVNHIGDSLVSGVERHSHLKEKTN